MKEQHLLKNKIMKKNLENAIFQKYNRHYKLSAIAKISGMTQQTMYEINKNPDYNLTIRSIDKIYKATKEVYGEGLLPWEYLNCSNFGKESVYNVNELAIKKAKEAVNEMEAIHEEHESTRSTVSGETTAAEIDSLLNIN